MQNQSYDKEGLAQANAILTRSKSVVIEKLAQMIVTMNAMQAQLNILSSDPINQTRTKINYYCWSCGIDYTHRSKTFSSKKSGNQEEAYHNNIMGGSKKVV